MTRHTDVLIAGSGAAGHAAAKTLRSEGFTGAISMVHNEPAAPYNRTLVDKALLPGLLTAEQAALPGLSQQDVALIAGTVTDIDSGRRTARLDYDELLEYRSLVIATGSAPRKLAPELRLDGVYSLHTTADAMAIREYLGGTFEDRAVTILGAGLLGTEIASLLVTAGSRVHLVARSSLPLESALGAPIAGRLLAQHTDHTSVRLGRSVTAIEKHSDLATVHLDSGESITSEVVIVAQGTIPNSALLTGSNAGVTVSDRLRAAGEPDVFAAGGVAVHASGTGVQYRVDHWDAAAAQGDHVARVILHELGQASDPGPYHPTTGFSVNAYKTTISGAGITIGAADTATTDGGGIVTTFVDSQGETVGAVGWESSRDVFAIRQRLASKA